MKSGLDQSLRQYPKGKIFCQNWLVREVDTLTLSSIPENQTIKEMRVGRQTTYSIDLSMRVSLEATDHPDFECAYKAVIKDS